MKKIMVIGAIDAGKTSLVMRIHGIDGIATKTQTLEYKNHTIDTPGEYMENPMMYKALMSTAMEAKFVLFVQDSTVNKTCFPPGFARAFPCKSIGIITKIDHPESDLENAKKLLERVKVKGPTFAVSSFTGECIQELKEFMNLTKQLDCQQS
ncbi:MAG: ethanolamine utilization protein EutP [Clostridiales bacterium]|nr:ethanolamine utilization protein EutP [Clostridiales bacterium]